MTARKGRVQTEEFRVLITIKSGLCGDCHCPNAWASLAAYLARWGKLERGKVIQIQSGETSYTYEHHETGAEIVAFLALGAASLAFAKAVVDLISCMFDAMRKDKRSKESPVTIVIKTDVNVFSVHAVTLPTAQHAKSNIATIAEAALNQVLAAQENRDGTMPQNVAVFSFSTQRATKVQLAGDFNSWQGSPMENIAPGEWVAKLSLSPGQYRYKFIVDGEWITDPANGWREQDTQGNLNSITYIPTL